MATQAARLRKKTKLRDGASRLAGELRKPQRTCLGCNRRDHQQLLLRLSLSVGNRLIVGSKGAGRSGYLHRDPACWQALMQRRSLYRAFHVEVDKRAREQLIRELKDGDWE